MALSYVGGKTFGHNATTAQTCSLTDLTGGSDAAPQAGDVVFVAYSFSVITGNSRLLADIVPAGYTALQTAIVTTTESNSLAFAASGKQMGGTPDTSVAIPASTATTRNVSVTIHVWRGVDWAALTPATAVSGINTALPDPPSATTPASPTGCVVLGLFGAAQANATTTAITNAGATPYDTGFLTGQWGVGSSSRSVSGIGAKTGLAASATFDATLSGGATANTGSWGAVSLVLQPATSGGSTGTGAATEGVDSTAATGTVNVSGAATSTEAADATTSTGATTVRGTASAAEDTDTASSAGIVAIVGTASATETGDTAAATGAVRGFGPAAATEAPDTSSATGHTDVTGAGATTEAPDGSAGSGTAAISGAAASVETADTSAGTGTVGAAGITGSASATEGLDSASAVGAVSVTGIAAATGDDALGSGSGAVLISGDAAANDNDDTTDATGRVLSLDGPRRTTMHAPLAHDKRPADPIMLRPRQTGSARPANGGFTRPRNISRGTR